MGYAVETMAAGIPDGRVAEPVKVFLKEMFKEETLDPDEMTLPSAGQMSDNISSVLDATLRDAALEAFYDSTREGEGNSIGDNIPDEMIDENGDFIRDWSEWGLGHGETLELRDTTWGDVAEQDAPIASENSDMNSHFNLSTETMMMAEMRLPPLG